MKYTEKDILARYERMLEKASLDEEEMAIEKATQSTVERCMGDSASDNLAAKFARRFNGKVEKVMSNYALGRAYYFSGHKNLAMKKLQIARHDGDFRASGLIGKIKMKEPDAYKHLAYPFLEEGAEKGNQPELYNVLAELCASISNYDEMVDYYKKAIEAGNLGTSLVLAERLFVLKRFEEARNYYEKALNEGFSSAIQQLEEIQVIYGDDEYFTDLFERANDKAKGLLILDKGVKMILGGLQTKDEKRIEAGVIMIKNAFLDYKTNDYQVIFNWLVRLKKYEEARTFCEKLKENGIKCNSLIGKTYLYENDFTMAEKTFQEGANNGEFSCCYDLSLLYALKGDSQKQIEALKLAKKTRNPDVYLLLAHTLEHSGNYKEAKENFYLAKKFGLNASSQLEFIAKMITNDDMEEASAVVDGILNETRGMQEEIADSFLDFLMTLDYRTSMQLCLKVMARGNKLAYYWISKISYMKGNIDEAINYANEAVKAGIKGVGGELAKMYRLVGQTKIALEIYEKTLDSEGMTCEQIGNYATLLAQEGRNNEAIEHMTYIADKGYTDILPYLYKALVTVGDMTRASLILQLAKKRGVDIDFNILTRTSKKPEDSSTMN